ncbi:MAG: MFS transporter, partial [Thiohalomonadaceae bacterium]
MPYWRLSSFYLFYFASLGALLPYWSLYLQQRGFSALEIGELMAVLMATRIVAPNLWGWLGDRTGRRMTVVRLGALLAMLSFAGVFLARGYWDLALVMFAFSFFWNAVLPQFETNTLVHLGDQHHRYSQVRLWGSIGFILAVVGLGVLFDVTGPALLPAVLLSMFGAIWAASRTVPDSGIARTSNGERPIGEVLRRPDVIAMLVACLLMQA